MMTKLRAMRKQFGIHKYRDGKKNRHGHTDDFPSYWALGYKSLLELKRNVTDDEYRFLTLNFFCFELTIFDLEIMLEFIVMNKNVV